jgi:hypothetical protein
MIKKKSVTNTTWENSVGDLKVIYTAKSDEGVPFESVNARVSKYDDYMGSANIDKDGSTGISLNVGLTLEERKSVIVTILEDTNDIFNPQTQD